MDFSSRRSDASGSGAGRIPIVGSCPAAARELLELVLVCLGGDGRHVNEVLQPTEWRLPPRMCRE